MRSIISLVSLLLAAQIPRAVAAQDRGSAGAGIPRDYRPPPGLCRVWTDGVPPARQPDPVDCRTAIRQPRPRGSVIVFGDAVTVSRRSSQDRWYGHRSDLDSDTDSDSDSDSDAKRGRRSRGRRGSDVCVDRDRDGWCDDVHRGRRPARYPRTLPEMIGTILIEHGRRTREQERWLGSGTVRGRHTDVDRDGIPERVVWLDAAGRVVQIWTDRNRDGRADEVRIYRNGRLERVLPS